MNEKKVKHSYKASVLNNDQLVDTYEGYAHYTHVCVWDTVSPVFQSISKTVKTENTVVMLKWPTNYLYNDKWNSGSL